MKSLQDALYNWLTIKVVADVRTDDKSAIETEKLFYDLLLDEHGLTHIQIEKDEDVYCVYYHVGEEEKSMRFPAELIEVMLKEMIAEPEKFINYPTSS